MTTRRAFLQSALALPALTMRGAAARPAERIVVGVVGTRIRGKALSQIISAFDDVEIAYLCDPDAAVAEAARKALPQKLRREPKIVPDMRTVFDDKAVDAVIVAAPDHWHALATVRACDAGKHVYVEKPASHNVVEGRKMIDAARRNKRVVQVGTQRRSAEFLMEARDYVKSGKLGKVPFARAWIAGNRKTIGKVADSPTPKGVDYSLWLGPAPDRAFNKNRFHYNWHWFWDYGTGEIGNNGIHGLDVIRMLMPALDAPTRVSSGGGRNFYDDDQQTPDTQIVTYDFPGTTVVWEHRIWAKTGLRGKGFGVELVGEKGTLVFDGETWSVEGDDKAKGKSGGGVEKAHLRNFFDCTRTGAKPNADIEQGHLSTRLCHLGNIAHRTGRAVAFDAAKETIVGDEGAVKLLGREYRKGFEMPG